jgi:hypothetical protein
MKLLLSVDGIHQELDVRLFEFSNSYAGYDAAILIETAAVSLDVAAVPHPSGESVVADQLPNTLTLDAVFTDAQKQERLTLWGDRLKTVLPEDEVFRGPTSMEYVTEEFPASDATSLKGALHQLLEWEKGLRDANPHGVFKVVTAPEIRFSDDRGFFKIYEMLVVYTKISTAPPALEG